MASSVRVSIMMRTRALLLPDLVIASKAGETTIIYGAYVHGQIAEDKEYGHEQDIGLNHRKVAVEDGCHAEPAQTGPGKDAFHHKGAGYQLGQAHAQGGEAGLQGIAEDMTQNGQAFAAAGPGVEHEIALLGLYITCTCCGSWKNI